MLPRPPVLAVLLALVLLLTACAGDGERSGGGSGTTTPSASASGSATPSTSPSGPSSGPDSGPDSGSAPPAPDAPRYVALGDSYTAAPLVPETDTSDGCLQSTGNYPHLVAAALGYRLDDVSCSGATTASLVGVQEVPGGGARPPQLDAVNRRTDLVTVSIGANDGGLFSTLVGRCLELARRDPTGAPCRAAQERSGETDALLATTRQLVPRTAAVVAGIRDRAPDAQVVVVTYPRLVPTRGTCDALPLATGDYPYARRVNRALAQALLRGARRAGADVVDLYRLGRGHDICADDPWVNGAQTLGASALAFHPLPAEQQAVADAVVARVGGDDGAG